MSSTTPPWLVLVWDTSKIVVPGVVVQKLEVASDDVTVDVIVLVWLVLVSVVVLDAVMEVVCDTELVLETSTALAVIPTTTKEYTPSPTSESILACSSDVNELRSTLFMDSSMVATSG